MGQGSNVPPAVKRARDDRAGNMRVNPLKALHIFDFKGRPPGRQLIVTDDFENHAIEFRS